MHPSSLKLWNTHVLQYFCLKTGDRLSPSIIITQLSGHSTQTGLHTMVHGPALAWLKTHIKLSPNHRSHCTWMCCVDISGDVKKSWLTPAASGVARKTFPGVASCLARITLLGVEPSRFVKMNCLPVAVWSSAVTIWIFCPVCWSVTIW